MFWLLLLDQGSAAAEKAERLKDELQAKEKSKPGTETNILILSGIAYGYGGGRSGVRGSGRASTDFRDGHCLGPSPSFSEVQLCAEFDDSRTTERTVGPHRC